MKAHLSLIFFIVLFSFSVHAQQGNNRSCPIDVGTLILNLIILIHKIRKISQMIILGDLLMMSFINLL